MSKKIGRNEPCGCGSGKKFKNCCGNLSMIEKWFNENTPNGSDSWDMGDTKSDITVTETGHLPDDLQDKVYDFVLNEPVFGRDCHGNSLRLSQMYPQIQTVHGFFGVSYSLERIKKYVNLDTELDEGGEFSGKIRFGGPDEREWFYDTISQVLWRHHSWNVFDGYHFDITIELYDGDFEVEYRDLRTVSLSVQSPVLQGHIDEYCSWLKEESISEGLEVLNDRLLRLGMTG